MTDPRLQTISRRSRLIRSTSSDTGAGCPDCDRPTIRRIGGEWCRWCRGFVDYVAIFREDERGTIRVLRNAARK